MIALKGIRLHFIVCVSFKMIVSASWSLRSQYPALTLLGDSLAPRPHPASHRLQYRAGKPGNEASLETVHTFLQGIVMSQYGLDNHRHIKEAFNSLWTNLVITSNVFV